MTRLLALFVLLLPLAVSAQDQRERTEKQIKALESLISADRERLSSARSREQSQIERLDVLTRQLARTEELEDLYARQLRTLQAEQDSMYLSLQALEAELSDVKQQYQRRALHGYKYGRLHSLALILSASSINEMLVRIQYLRRFTEVRKLKLDVIVDKGSEIAAKREQLQESVQETAELAEEARARREEQESLRAEHASLMNQLKADRASVEDELAQKRAEQQRLKQHLSDLIAAEIEAARLRAGASSAAESAAAVRLSGSFRDNRGKLPWPVSGSVTKPHGTTINPVTGSQTPHPGVEIATVPHSDVRAVFDGRVTTVSNIALYGNFVVVQHGDQYWTVYGNLSEVRVSAGQTVTAGSTIAKSGGANEPLGAVLFFGVFDGNADVNPTTWLSKR